jgi:hypothetical protein
MRRRRRRRRRVYVGLWGVYAGLPSYIALSQASYKVRRRSIKYCVYYTNT